MRVSTVAALLFLASVVVGGAQRATGAAWLVRSLDDPSDIQESGASVLDAPILPGSMMKAVTLVAALESHVIEPDTTRICRRVVTIDGRRYVCSHPDLKRALTPAEALAHSCNDFFVSLAPLLSRAKVNEVRARVGLPPLPLKANFAASLVGLDGPRISPRVLLASMTRLIGVDRARPFTTSESTRRVLLEGLRGAATYGSASELDSRHISALAKTGTAPMPGGGFLGLLVAFTPPDAPRRAAIVVAPGAAGRDATSIAADLLTPSPDRIRVGSLDAAGHARITDLPLEDYVARVVTGEGQPGAPAAAQEALAIAARTFALANPSRHAADGYDMCDTTHCQALRPATPAAKAAAAATAGRVLLDQNHPAPIFYSASCGGHTELPSHVWPGAIDYRFLPSQRDESCGDEGAWTSEITAPEIERALRAAGLKGDALRRLAIVARSSSGRVTRLRADGFSPSEVYAEEFRLAVGRTAGWALLKSTAFEMRRSSRGYQFTGRGVGHGVGMCVVGAACRAASGATAAQILHFYYPGLRIGQYDVNVTSSADDVRLALPAEEEHERDAVAGLIRRARGDIAARTGVRGPPAIRVTVHANIEAFTRETGQPWWVAAATRGTNIDLIPLTLLRRRGQLERTIRHEVTHVLLDQQLAGRPMWVREGAAFYFADRSVAAQARTAAAPCPVDGEFQHPASAAVQRDTYARAEACFVRQIAAGRSWRDIR